MGNRLSYEAGNDSSDVDYGGTNPNRTSTPKLRESNLSKVPVSAKPKHGVRYGSPPIPAGYDSDCYEIPAAAFSSRAPRRPKRQKKPAAAHSEREFDFNDNRQPLPWNRGQQDGVFEFRAFARSNDAQLLAYLASRSIAPEFLREIDLFLQGHPEIASTEEGRTFLEQISTWPPLDAYKLFLQGYTNPARYIDGLIKTEYFELPTDYIYYPLGEKYDQELVDWFSGHKYCHVIIARIDWEVNMSIRDLRLGRDVHPDMRKLMSYCIWGNPVDAFKYYEYSYQQEYMPHRYLPEHVVLRNVLRRTDGTPPQPSVDGGRLKHREVRYRMARANDQGVDVLDVLIAEYKQALVRRGHRRLEIERLCDHANDKLDRERQDPTGVDIVDMIMDDATSRRGTRRRVSPRHAHRQAQPSYFTDLNGSAPAYAAPSVPNYLIKGLQQAKKNLVRLYAQEDYALRSNAVDTHVVCKCRRSAERRYVNCLVLYLRSANRMSSAQAKLLQEYFVAGGMAGMMVGNHQNYLLAMWPTELN